MPHATPDTSSAEGPPQWRPGDPPRPATFVCGTCGEQMPQNAQAEHRCNLPERARSRRAAARRLAAIEEARRLTPVECIDCRQKTAPGIAHECRLNDHYKAKLAEQNAELHGLAVRLASLGYKVEKVGAD